MSTVRSQSHMLLPNALGNDQARANGAVRPLEGPAWFVPIGHHIAAASCDPPLATSRRYRQGSADSSISRGHCGGNKPSVWRELAFGRQP